MALAYKILNVILNLKILKVNYEVYCGKCNKFTGEIFETISEMPEEVECFDCDSLINSVINPLTSSIVVYKVVVDE